MIGILGLIARSLRVEHMLRDAGDESDDVIHVYVWRPFFLGRGVELFTAGRSMGTGI